MTSNTTQPPPPEAKGPQPELGSGTAIQVGMLAGSHVAADTDGCSSGTVLPIQRGLQAYRSVMGAAVVVVEYGCGKPCAECLAEFCFSCDPNQACHTFLRPVLKPEQPSSRMHMAALLLFFLACLVPLPLLCIDMHLRGVLSLAAAVCVGVLVSLPLAGVAFFTLPWVVAWSYWFVAVHFMFLAILVFGSLALVVLAVAYMVAVLLGMVCAACGVLHMIVLALCRAPSSAGNHTLGKETTKGGDV